MTFRLIAKADAAGFPIQLMQTKKGFTLTYGAEVTRYDAGDARGASSGFLSAVRHALGCEGMHECDS